jgi:hypothetical protein
MDDSGNPIFSQEGTIDMDSFIKETLSDNNDIKRVFQEKFKSLADSLKIDNKKVSDTIIKNVSDLFKFPQSFKSDVQKSVKNNVDKLFSNLSLDEKSINNNIKELFSYKDKNNSFKSIFDKIESSVSDKLLDSADKPNSKLKISAKEKLDIVDKIQNVRIDDISPNVFKPIILDVNVMDMGEGLIKFISSVLSDDISEKNYLKLEPLFEKFNVASSGGEQTDTTFENEPQPFILVGISPSILEDLTEAMEGDEEPQTPAEKEKKGGIWEMLKNALGIGTLGGIAGLGKSIMGTIASVFKLPLNALKFATNPLTLLIAGLAWGVFDGIKSVFKAEEWGTSKISAFLGGFISGETGGLLGNMGKLALIGAGIGIVGGPIGSLIGGLVGGILGAIFNAIGAERMAKAFDSFGSWVSEKYNEFVEGLTAFFIPVFEEISNTWNSIKGWYEDSLKPAIDEFKEEIQPVVERVKSFFLDKLIPDLKNLLSLFEPLFELMSNAVSEYIWPTIKDIGSLVGGKIVTLFEDLAYYIDIFVGTIENMYDAIKWGLGRIKDGIEWLSNKVGSLVSWITGEKEEEQNSAIAALEGQREVVKKYNEKRNQQLEEIAKLEAEGNEVKLQLAKEQLAYTESKISEWEGKLSQTESENSKKSTRAKDLLLDYANPNSIQIQLDENDKMYNFEGGAAFAKGGGALDQAINSVAEKIEEQMKKADILNNMFESYMQMFNQYNAGMFELIPKLVEGGKSAPQVPSETSIPDGYIRDPIYEFRMKARERLYI